MIFTGFSPNSSTKDVKIASFFYLFPYLLPFVGAYFWRKGNSEKIVEHMLQKYFSIDHAITFDSGRSALHFGLEALGVEKGDIVAVQAYTCGVVINAIRWLGAEPLYIDTSDDFNMDPADLQRKSEGKTVKALIIQHTFGIPAQTKKLLDIAKEQNMRTIEDCAHSLGVKSDGTLTGLHAELGMLSFGSDKMISCVRGGAVITNSDEIGERLKEIQQSLPQTALRVISQHLLHYPIFYFGKKLYSLVIGKILLKVASSLGIINKIIYRPEKKGRQVDFYPTQMPNVLAVILKEQLGELDTLNAHRRDIAKMYDTKLRNHHIRTPQTDSETVYLRYPVLVDNPQDLLSYAKRKGIILGNWYSRVVAPVDMDMSQMHYTEGSCPNAELLSSQSVNLPTNRNITKKKAEYIIDTLNAYVPGS